MVQYRFSAWNGNNKEILEKKANNEGWGTLRGKGNLCPVCNHKMTLQEFIQNYQYR